MHYRFNLPRRKLVLGSLATLGVAATGSLATVQALGAEDGLINLQLGYIAGADQIAEVTARAMGYFKDEGLTLAIQPGGPSVDGLAVVASGRYEVGEISSSPSIMLATSQGIPIQSFAAGLQRHPYGYFSLKKNPVRTPQDFIGKRVGVAPTGVILLRLLLAKNKIPENQVTIIPIGGDMSPLLTGRADVVTGWLSNTSSLRALGDERVGLTLWDAGVHLYAWPYYATQSTLQTRPDLLVRFLRATARGWHVCRTQPDRAIDYLMKDYPQLNREDERAALAIKLQCALDDETVANGWGTMSAERWQQQITQFDQLGQFSGHVPMVNEVMTTAILDKTRSVRMAV